MKGDYMNTEFVQTTLDLLDKRQSTDGSIRELRAFEAEQVYSCINYLKALLTEKDQK
jgi:hypothetical protein